MSSEALSPGSYALIGMLCLRGPSTAYELKHAMGHIAREFWSVGHTHNYIQTARLEKLGLLTSTQEAGGRRRRVFEVTAAGRAALLEWLKAPTPESLQLRDIALLKLFLSELGDPEDVVALAETQADLYRERLAHLDELEARFGDDPGRDGRMAVVPFGRSLYRGALEFWISVAEQPPHRR